MSDKPMRIPPELEDVVNQVGEFLEYWGFKNVHGRIWTHLFLAEEPLDAADLVERLGISKALVSMSISDLIEHDVIKTVGRSTRGTVLYQPNPNLMSVITNVLRKRERRMLGRLSSAARLLKNLPKEAHGQIQLSSQKTQALLEMVRTAELTLDGMLQMTEVSFEAWHQFQNVETDDKGE